MAAFWKILVKYRMLFIGGVKITLIVSVLTIILGTFFGILMAFMKMSKIKPLRWFANAYVEFIRGTPVLVQISLVFYGLPMMGINIPSIMVGGTDISRLAAGIIALTINTTAYICEIVRGGILSVDRGQTEAALALGMGNVRTLICIVLPQAMKNILPSMGNEFITIIKDSSLLQTIGVMELWNGAQSVVTATYLPITPLLFAAFYYLMVTTVLSFLLKKLENRMGNGGSN